MALLAGESRGRRERERVEAYAPTTTPGRPTRRSNCCNTWRHSSTTGNQVHLSTGGIEHARLRSSFRERISQFDICAGVWACLRRQTPAWWGHPARRLGKKTPAAAQLAAVRGEGRLGFFCYCGCCYAGHRPPGMHERSGLVGQAVIHEPYPILLQMTYARRCSGANQPVAGIGMAYVDLYLSTCRRSIFEIYSMTTNCCRTSGFG